MIKVKRILLSDILVLSGSTAISVGAGMISLPAGLIVGGICAITLALLIGLGVKKDAA